jgi:hypothetical protein
MVGVARPEGFEHALPTIVIQGLEELVEALRAAEVRGSGREAEAASDWSGREEFHLHV